VVRRRTLFLMPSAQEMFLPLLEREFPELVARYRELYARARFWTGGYKSCGEDSRAYGLEAGPHRLRPELWKGRSRGAISATVKLRWIWRASITNCRAG